jgi:hypothetical protein
MVGERSYPVKPFVRHTKGYIRIHSKDHPYKDGQGYVFQHRLIYEHYLSIMFDEQIYLPKEVDIHHINGNVQDNSLINLEALDHTEHRRLHRLDRTNTFCNICGSTKTYCNWYGDHINGCIVCSLCYKMIKLLRKKMELQ